MAASTALLPKKEKEHPIFLRVCHSPWVGIGQKALVGLRSMTLSYLLISFAMIIDYDYRRNKHGKLIFFEFSNVAYALQILYQTIAFTWTFMHLHYPHHSQQDSRWSRLQAFFSPPRQTLYSSNKTWFSIFYSAAQTFPYVATFIYWAILVPYNKAEFPVDEIFGHGWFRVFYVFNKYGINSFLAFLEVFFYSSIKRQHPISAHVFGLIILSCLYIAWAGLGYVITDKYDYFFFDHRQVGWEYTFTSNVGFVALVLIFFAAVYYVTWFRELITKKGDAKQAGYQQLPQ